jgi:hypothetical protein
MSARTTHGNHSTYSDDDVDDANGEDDANDELTRMTTMKIWTYCIQLEVEFSDDNEMTRTSR